MTLSRIAPILTTENIEATTEFYTKTLGFKCNHYEKTDGWVTLRRDDVAIMFGLPNAHETFDKPEFTGSLYMYTDDVDSEWDSIKDKVSLCYPLETFDYGMREFGFYDNNGYLLKYGQAAQ